MLDLETSAAAAATAAAAAAAAAAGARCGLTLASRWQSMGCGGQCFFFLFVSDAIMW
jgi:hypothetical protein